MPAMPAPKAYQKKPVVTQVGSLPFKRVDSAIDYSLSHSIPFLPELVNRGDSMYEYIKHPGKLACLKEFNSLYHDIAKVQCIGPITLMSAPASYSENDATERVINHLSAILHDLDARRKIVALDEPAVGTSGLEFRDRWNFVFEGLESVYGEITRVVHTCGNMDWSRMFDAGLDVISLDASRYGDIMVKSPGYEEYRRNGGNIAWGITGADGVKDFRGGDLITPPCGLGRSSVSHCHRKLEQMVRVARAEQLAL